MRFNGARVGQSSFSPSMTKFVAYSLAALAKALLYRDFAMITICACSSKHKRRIVDVDVSRAMTRSLPNISPSAFFRMTRLHHKNILTNELHGYHIMPTSVFL